MSETKKTADTEERQKDTLDSLKKELAERDKRVAQLEKDLQETKLQLLRVTNEKWSITADLGRAMTQLSGLEYREFATRASQAQAKSQ